MRLREAILFCAVAIFVAGCASTTSTANEQVVRGMSTSQVLNLLGKPDGREIRGKYEALLYFDVVGFGQCEYITIFTADDEVLLMQSERGGSIGGCGIGADPVDWSQIEGEEQLSSVSEESKLNAERDRYADLERLKDLFDDGALTQEEYDREKAKILSD